MSCKLYQKCLHAEMGNCNGDRRDLGCYELEIITPNDGRASVPLDEIVMFKKIVDHLKHKLEISVDQVTEFGPIEQIKVTLELDGKEISYSACDLPDQET